MSAPGGDQEGPAIPGPGDDGLTLRRRPDIGRLWQAIRPPGLAQAVHVTYPKSFQALVALTFLASAGWVVHFFLRVFPLAEEVRDGPCKYNEDQLMMNAKMIFLYFFWCFTVRIVACVPGVSTHIAQVRVDTHGTLRVYIVHMFFYGPLYFYTIASLLYWVQLANHPACQPQNNGMLTTMKLYASYSFAVGFACLLLLFWQHRLINAALRESEEEHRRAPPDTIDKLLTLQFDASLFSDDDATPYPGECPICMMEWEPEDCIKITPCRHAFHKECLSGWLRNNRTCALCRHDVTQPARPAGGSAPQPTPVGASASSAPAATPAGPAEESAPQPPLVGDGLSGDRIPMDYYGAAASSALAATPAGPAEGLASSTVTVVVDIASSAQTQGRELPAPDVEAPEGRRDDVVVGALPEGAGAYDHPGSGRDVGAGLGVGAGLSEPEHRISGV